MLLRFSVGCLLLLSTGCTTRSLWNFDDDTSVPVSKQFHRTRGRAVLDPEIQSQIDDEMAAQESPEHTARTDE